MQSYIPLAPIIENPSVFEYTITQLDHGLQTGTLYSFKIMAINDVGTSDFSDELQSIMPAELPTPPTNPQMISSTSSTIHLEWFDPVSNGGTPISDYQIYWDNGSSGSQFELLASTTLGMNSYFQQSGLEAGVYYTYKIRAVNHIGASPSSKSLKVVASSAPQPPVSLTRVNSTMTSVTFAWEENQNNGGAEVRDH